MTESSDPIAAAGRGHMRASHADREHVIDTLKAAFVQGRLTKDELDQRVGQAFTSKTYAELAALSADLPADLAPSRSRPVRAQGPSLGSKKVLEWAIVSVLSPLAPLAAAALTQNVVFGMLTVIMLILDIVVGLPFLMIVVGTMVGRNAAPPAPKGNCRRDRAADRPAASGAAGLVTIWPRPVGPPTRHAPTCELTTRALAGDVTRRHGLCGRCQARLKLAGHEGTATVPRRGRRRWWAGTSGSAETPVAPSVKCNNSD